MPPGFGPVAFRSADNYIKAVGSFAAFACFELNFLLALSSFLCSSTCPGRSCQSEIRRRSLTARIAREAPQTPPLPRPCLRWCQVHLAEFGKFRIVALVEVILHDQQPLETYAFRGGVIHNAPLSQVVAEAYGVKRAQKAELLERIEAFSREFTQH